MARKLSIKSGFDFAFAGTLPANQPSGVTASGKELKKKALALVPTDRIELAETLLASVEDFISSDVEKAWRKEVAGRVDEIRSGRAKLIPAAEVHRRARS
jgi:putative addiction module component (TIGR02574 family)